MVSGSVRGLVETGQQHFGSWRSLSDICSANITLPCFYQSQVSKLP